MDRDLEMGLVTTASGTFEAQESGALTGAVNVYDAPTATCDLSPIIRAIAAILTEIAGKFTSFSTSFASWGTDGC